MVNTHKIILSALVSYSVCIGNIFAATPRTSESNFAQPQKSKALKTQTK